MSMAWTAVGLSHTAKLVLLALADNANDAGVCWPSIPKVANRCSLDERTVFRAIAMLEGGGHVTTEARPGKSTIYRVHPLQPSTPDRESPLTGGHPCHKVTPDIKSGTPDSLSPPITSEVLSSQKSESSRTVRSSLRSPRARVVPADFVITEDMRKWAKSKCPNVDIDAETEKFRDHEYRDPHSNWVAAWRQWMRRAPEFLRSNGSKNEDTGWRPNK